MNDQEQTDDPEIIPNDGYLVKSIEKLAPDQDKVGAWVSKMREDNPELTKEELAEHVAKKIVWTFTRQGVATALPGAIPGLGTIVQIGTSLSCVSVDLALMIRNQAYLVFAVAEALGHEGRSTRIQDILISIGLWSNALQLSRSGVIRIGNKIVEANFKKRFPAKILQTINRKVGTTILTKYGTKRGGVAIGKLIPFGVGSAIGGGFNYLTMTSFKRTTLKYLRTKIENQP